MDNGSSHRSPADVAASISAVRLIRSDADLESQFEQTLAQIGLSGTTVTGLRVHARLAGALDVYGLDEPRPRVDRLLDAWLAVLDEKLDLSPADAMRFEQLFAQGAAQLVDRMPRGLKYVKTLHVMRERVAIALHDYAREVNWQRPVLYVRILRLARSYLRAVVSAEELTRPEFRNGFSGRLGVCTALIAGFEQQSLSELTEGVDALLLSLKQGNRAESAVPYLLDLAAMKFDVDQDTRELRLTMASALRSLSDSGLLGSFGAFLPRAEIGLRLASIADLGSRGKMLEDARSFASHVAHKSTDTVSSVRALMLLGVLDHVDRDPGALETGACVGLSLPFGARGSAGCSLLHESAPEVLARLVPLLEAGEPLSRAVTADIFEWASDPSASSDSSRSEPADLRRASTLRGGLRDRRSQFLSLRDDLRIAGLTGDSVLRRDTIAALLELARDEEDAVTPLVMIARDVEESGACDQLRGFDGDLEQVAVLVRRGDWQVLLGRAAEAAMRSADLARVPLGGRSGAASAADWFGLVGETFVFKDLLAEAAERERDRASALQRSLDAQQPGSNMVIATHLCDIPVDGGRVTSVRRYVPGRPVSEALKGASRADKLEMLGGVAEFLGRIHRAEPAPEKLPRRDLKVREVGRWLREAGVADADEMFAQWWQIVGKAAPCARRDAHLDNWLVGGAGEIVAIDLEAIGSRPAGYELAQVTDDMPVLDAGDWDARDRLFGRYSEARDADPAAREVEWAAYEASVAGRALGKLTWSVASLPSKEHAMALLGHIGNHGTSPELRLWCRVALDAWFETRGLAFLGAGALQASPRRRRRVSKAMAYHLRHDTQMPVDEHGWARMQDLADAIGGSVRAVDVALVASTMSEPRFEERNGLVRARYGHSNPAISVEVGALDARTAGGKLYHATTPESARKILESGQGLRPMSRQYVHLSTEITEALVAGSRRRSSVLLASRLGRGSTEFFRASRTTVVARGVPKSALSVEPVFAYWEFLNPLDLSARLAHNR